MIASQLSDQDLRSVLQAAYVDPEDDAAFLDDLDDVLDDYEARRVLGLAIGSPDLALDAVLPPGRRAARRRMAALASSGGVLAGAITAVVLLVSSSAPALAQKFPALARRPVASPGRGAIELLRQQAADTTGAVGIQTHYGTGYVTSAAAGKRLCLAVPGSVFQIRDSATSTGTHLRYVGGCYPVAQAEGRGVVLTMPTPRGVEYVLVLPKGATKPIVVAANGTAKQAPVEDEIATSIVANGSKLDYEVNGKKFSAFLSAAKPLIVHAPES